MKKILFSIAVLLCLSQSGLACCWARQTRIFPLGEQDGKLIMAYFELSRHCYQAPDDPFVIGFSWKGKVSIGTWTGESILPIQLVDSFEFFEGFPPKNLQEDSLHAKAIPDWENHYIHHLKGYYERALDLASRLKGFRSAKPLSYHYHQYDSITGYRVDDESFVHLASQKEWSTVISDDIFPLSNIYALRRYEIGNKVVSVVTLAGITAFLPDFPYLPLSKSAYHKNKTLLVELESAFSRAQADWHGITKDYVLVE